MFRLLIPIFLFKYLLATVASREYCSHIALHSHSHAGQLMDQDLDILLLLQSILVCVYQQFAFARMRVSPPSTGM